MLRTRVGYAGGSKEKPTYHAMGDHTEAIAIDFDPTVISYEELLTRFWDNHYCASNVRSAQYRHAVFYHNDEQRKLAEATRETAAAKAGITLEQVGTAIVPATPFTYAETYHQKYALTRHHDLRDFLEETYPTGKALADSAVATRLNAYLGSGFDKAAEAFGAELASYGLPESLSDYVRKHARVR